MFHDDRKVSSLVNFKNQNYLEDKINNFSNPKTTVNFSNFSNFNNISNF